MLRERFLNWWSRREDSIIHIAIAAGLTLVGMYGGVVMSERDARQKQELAQEGYELELASVKAAYNQMHQQDVVSHSKTYSDYLVLKDAIEGKDFIVLNENSELSTLVATVRSQAKQADLKQAQEATDFYKRRCKRMQQDLLKADARYAELAAKIVGDAYFSIRPTLKQLDAMTRRGPFTNELGVQALAEFALLYNEWIEIPNFVEHYLPSTAGIKSQTWEILELHETKPNDRVKSMSLDFGPPPK